MHNHDDKYPARPGFEPDTSRLQASVDTNESSGADHNVRNTIKKQHSNISFIRNAILLPQIKKSSPTMGQH